MQANMARYLAHDLNRLIGIPVDQVSATRSFQELGVDSLFLLRLLRDFEQVFQVKLSARDVFTCPTLGSLAELAASRCTAPESKKKSEYLRSEERRDGKECGSTSRYRWWPVK